MLLILVILPDAELTSVGAENFEWVVEESAKMAIAAAKKQSLENESYIQGLL
jgi:hypothetical protein